MAFGNVVADSTIVSGLDLASEPGLIGNSKDPRLVLVVLICVENHWRISTVGIFGNSKRS